MGTREDLLERVSAARRRRAEAGRELDEANQALHEHEVAAARADGVNDGVGDEILHPRLPRVTVRG